ncbi:glycosyltransferase family 9 protein [Lacinutrix sp. Bg11-31]|uniref:glycosyltransferase family 9 protein n=1 Tax=Lacinutrix sp. Bg11-31 TaxID=2057808 RepID=UPI000C318044|nr:glycosyltransferase family 9 protein [Lacinutrix sp. Bg11-31]AUC83004.1 ADP-heptose--LPS heptosyltransferase [Lacinutrix sp. Bg11-31]
MTLLKFDSIRQKIMPKLTRDIGKSHFNKKVKGTKKTKISKILICRPNQRLGNMLLITPLLQELIKSFPDCKIDLIVKGGVAKPVFQEYENVNNIIILPKKPFKELFRYLKIFFSVKIKKYDLVISGDKGSSSGRILTYLSNAKYKVYGTLEKETGAFEDDYYHMAKNNVYLLRHYLQQIGYAISTDPISNLDLKLTENEILNGKGVLNRSVIDSSKKTILIFTFATGNKCYSKAWWSTFYTALKAKFGDTYNILEVLPAENVSQIDFKAGSFYSKDIREIAAVIANAELFVGGDGGIMHLAAATKTTTVGLFSVTPTSKYRPYGNNNDFIDTKSGTVEDYMSLIESKL